VLSSRQNIRLLGKPISHRSAARARFARDLPGGKTALPSGKSATRLGVVLGHFCRV